jgi:hypothetical protein
MTIEQEVGTELTELPEEVCTTCGAAREQWADPVTKDGDRYCCADCASGKLCSCATTTPGI